MKVTISGKPNNSSIFAADPLMPLGGRPFFQSENESLMSV